MHYVVCILALKIRFNCGTNPGWSRSPRSGVEIFSGRQNHLLIITNCSCNRIIILTSSLVNCRRRIPSVVDATPRVASMATSVASRVCGA